MSLTVFLRYSSFLWPRAIFLSVALWSLTPTTSSAQPLAGAAPGDWLLLPIAEQDQAGELISQLRRPLEGSPATALDDEGGALAFEEAVSTPPQSVSDTELNAWADHSRHALRYLATADYDNARAELLAAQGVSERAAEEMNRSAERARRVLDTCLYMARALMETGQHTEALEQVRTCRVLVPKVEPGGFRHPPEVRAMLTRVDAEERHANLEVTSTPEGCLVRINGVPQGETPFAMENVARGDYRIQVECNEQRGRVHRARVDRDDQGTVSIHVDTALDAAIHSRPFLYADPGFRLESVALVAAAMSRPVLAMMRGGGDELSFWLVEANRASRTGTSSTGASSATRVTTVRTNRAGLRGALRALHERRSVDLRGDTPRPIVGDALLASSAGSEARDSEDAAPAEQASETLSARSSTRNALPTWRLGTGLALVGAGLGAVGIGTYLHYERAETGDFYASFTNPMMPGYLPNRDAWTQSSLTPTALFALGGGAAAALGVGLLVPAHEKVQWWAWALGGAGLVLAGASLVPVLTRSECGDVGSVEDLQHVFCINRAMAASKSVLLASAALPLLAIPISALIQSGSRGENARGLVPSLVPNLALSPTGFSLSIAGRLP